MVFAGHFGYDIEEITANNAHLILVEVSVRSIALNYNLCLQLNSPLRTARTTSFLETIGISACLLSAVLKMFTWKQVN